jgi:hypothetical protein
MKKNNYFIKKHMLLLVLSLVYMSSMTLGQGTWSRVNNQAPNGSGGLMLLLTDGTVMAKSNAGGGSGTIWMKLTPDIHGSYANGTWTNLAPMISDRLYFSSQILKDGRVYVAGGEYGAGQKLSEVYDPLANTWTALPSTGHTFSDANSELLPDGKVLQALVEGGLNSTLIWDPATNNYTNGPSTFGIIDESAWVKLPDNSILMVDRDSRNSERYIPSLNQWVRDASVPTDLYDPYGSETGAAFLLPDGRAFFIGDLGTTAFYTPSGNNNAGSWSMGPNLPNGLGAPDAAAAMLVNGKILCALSPQPTDPNHFPSPTYFYEFDYRNNSFTQVATPDGGNYATFVTNMLDLPDGTVLYCVQGSSQYYIYTPSGSQITTGKPVIGQVSANDCSGSSYTISGTGFTGISEGAGYGDDWQMASNYPIIRLTNGSNVYYARTYNWNNTGVQTGGAQITTQFKLPAGLPQATYSLVVTANGISSDPVSFTPSTCNSTGLVTVYKDCNYGGYSAGLNVGDYTTSKLNSLGVLDNDISSLNITEGYKIILYDGDNFTGNSITLTATNACLVNVGTNWNDIVSSVQVRTNGATNMAGVYFLQNRNSGLYADVWGLSTADGANIAQGTFNNGPNQQYQFNHLGDGTYQVLATHSMKTMDVNAISTADGANVQQWTYNGTPNQQFIVYSTGDGYYKLIPKHSGKVVEVANYGTANGDNIQQWTNVNQTSGMWKFVAPTASNGTGDGLTANYFNGQNFDNPKVTRKDASVNFDWGTGSPDPSITVDHFSARWTGQVQPRYSGIYTFYVTNDDGGRLWVNGQQIVNKWNDDGGTEVSGTIVLTGGQKYDIKFEYYENGGGAKAKLEWSSILQAREVVPQSQLYSNPAPTVSLTSPANNSTYSAPASVSLASNASDADGIAKVDYYNGTTLIASTTSPFTYTWGNVGQGTYTITAAATDAKGAVTVSSSVTITVNPSLNGNGDGLSGNYFNGMNFDSPAYSRKDATINFDWGTGSPDPSVNADQFSARWTGQIQPRYSETYTFYLNTDNGRRLWINNQLIVDKWVDDWGIEYTGTIALTGGQKYDIKLEYFENNGGAACKMEWSSASQAREVVPQSQLYSNGLPAVSITSPGNNASFNAPANISITASSSDQDGSIAKVDFYNGTTLLGTSTASPYSFAWNNVGNGTYALKAIATDNKGAFTISAPVTVKVNTVSSTTIQAENYSNMSGVATESTTDAGGGLDVGWIDQGDWMAYNSITFPTSGNYTISYRVASPSGATLSCDLNAGSIQLGSIAIPATGGWQNWTTITQTVSVTAGTYNFGIYAQAGGWNINWFTITSSPSKAKTSPYDLTSMDNNSANLSLDCYPNPADASLYLKSNLDFTGGNAKIIDGLGVEVISITVNSEAIDVSSLKGGIYTLVITKDGSKYTRRFVKQ